MHDKYIINFYEEVCKKIGNNYKLILEPTRNLKYKWIEYDTVKWETEEPIRKYVDVLLKDLNLTFEKKVLKLYEFICKNYIYDANVLYFFRKDFSDSENIKYIAVDWYGRIVGQDWINNRKKHNRRICYEFSRFYAKAINMLIPKNIELEAFMLGDLENTHYVVALTGKDYSIILDQDDFNGVKDLTRLKMGLTIKGIHVLRDYSDKFKMALDDFNKDRLEELYEIEQARKNISKNGLIDYFNIVIDIIKKYNIDSQGFFEYLRFIIEEQKISIEKIWKLDKRNLEKRYERCLYFLYNDKTYLLDSIDKNLSIVKLEELDKTIFIFNPEENEYKYCGG